MPRLIALGGAAIRGDDGLIEGSAGRGRNLAVLALLSRAGAAGLTRDKVAALLWSESDAERARHSLDQALYTLRRALGPDAIRAGAATLALDSDAIECDVLDFIRAAAAGAHLDAVGLYAGPFLDGFHLSGAAEFERWVDEERAQLHEQYAASLRALAQTAAAAGDHAAAVGHWRRLAAAEPVSSRVVLELMGALEAAGDRASAVRAADIHAALVRQEFEAPPDPAVLAYAARLRRPPDPAAPGAAATPGPPPETGSVAPALASGIGEKRTGRGRRSWWGIGFASGGLAVIALAVLIAGRHGGTAEPLPGVVVRSFDNETGNVAFDPVGRMAADWITEGLVRTGLVRVLDATGGTASAGEVSGRVYRTGDSLWFHARITEPGSGAVLRAPAAVGAAADDPSAALEPLRQGVLGALGTLYDPRLTTWAASALRPPSYAAYLEFVAGLELHAVPRDLGGAATRFERAAELDPEYVLPRLWLAWTAVMIRDIARADSLTAALTPVRDRMSPVERAWHDRIAALVAGDNEASYRAAKRLVAVAPPRSGWVVALANAALDTHRPDEASAVLLETGVENLGLEREWGWFLLTVAYHARGDYQRELAVTEEAIQAIGRGWGYAGPGVPALAALGRVDQLERRLDELRHGPPLEDGIPAGPTALVTAAEELRRHGSAAQANALVDRALAKDAAWLAPAAGDAAPARSLRLELLYELGRWEEAQGVLRQAEAAGDHDFFLQAMRGLLAARLGDSATARGVSADLAAVEGRYLFGEPSYWRARIEAAVGDPTEAVALLRQAFAEGQGAPTWHAVHVSRDFDALRDLPSFRALVEPRR